MERRQFREQAWNDRISVCDVSAFAVAGNSAGQLHGLDVSLPTAARVQHFMKMEDARHQLVETL